MIIITIVMIEIKKEITIILCVAGRDVVCVFERIFNPNSDSNNLKSKFGIIFQQL